MVVEGIGLHVEDILVSLVLSIIISWTFGILTHEENQYSYVYKILGQLFLSKALKQTKAGPRSSETLFPVNYQFIIFYLIHESCLKTYIYIGLESQGFRLISKLNNKLFTEPVPDLNYTFPYSMKAFLLHVKAIIFYKFKSLQFR